MTFSSARRFCGLLGTLLAATGCAGSQAVAPPPAPAPATTGEAAGPAPVVRVACVGEQTTHSAHREYDPEYPARLAQLLGAGFEVRNFGLPKGRVLVNGTGKESEPYGSSAEMAASLAFAPNVVVMGPWGRHDTYKGNWPEHKPEFAGDLEALLKRYLALPAPPKVLVVLPLPLNGTEDGPMSELVEPTRAVATALQLPIVDLWGAFLGKRELYKDSTHLRPDGQQRQAEVVAAAVRAALGR
jgi:hypothetical protein